MNPGYLSFLLLCIIIILLACGWKEQLIKGTTNEVVILFIISWFICSVVHIKLAGLLQVNLCYVLLIIMTLCIVCRMKTWKEILHIITVGLFISTFYVLINQLFFIEPILIIAHSFMYTSLILSITAALLTRHSLQQIAVITIGLIIGDLIYTFLKQGSFPYVLGNPILFDHWWLVFLETRIISEGMEHAWRRCRVFLRFWLKE